MESSESRGRTTRHIGEPLEYARRLRALFDSLPALVAYWNDELRNVIANPALLKWHGLTPDQVRGAHIRDVLGEELYEKDMPAIASTLDGEARVLERDLTDARGAVRHTQTTYLPDMLDGKSMGFFTVDADITPWVEATRALAEAQQMAQLGSWIHDLDSDVIVWTDELYRIFGVDPASFTPTDEAIAARLHPDDAELVRSARAAGRATGAGYDCTYRIQLPDGEVREVRGREMPQTGTDEGARLIGTVQDLTAVNAATRELVRLNSELARVNEVNADVLAMLGHDVRAPLAVMLGYLEELVDGWSTTSEAVQVERVGRIQRAAQRMEVLAEDILAMSAADAGELSPHLCEVKLADAVEAALAAISAEGLVKVTVSPELSVYADPFHVRQIIANLVTNAMRYGEPPIVLSAAQDGGTVTLRVRDHGTGVRDSAVPMLFERFATSGVSKPGVTLGPAAGFGLYSAARMATLDGGRLVYESADPGACFALTLPQAAVAA